MATRSTMGLKKIFFAPSNLTDNTQIPLSGWQDLGDIYKDTCTFVDSDPTITEHISETSARKIVQRTKGTSTLNLSLMDPDLDMLCELFGGKIEGEAGKRRWTEPAVSNDKEYAIKVYPQDGLCLNIPAAVITAKKNTTYSSQGITLVELQISPVGSIFYEEGAALPVDGSMPAAGEE